jgi:polyisoprenoid-binding protein YceI
MIQMNINRLHTATTLQTALAGPALILVFLIWGQIMTDQTGSERMTHQMADVVYYTGSGHAEFTSSVPLHSFTGESDHLTGMIDLQENVVDFYLDLGTLKTGIGRRDRDMYRTLKVDDHPYAEFTGRLASVFDMESGDAQKVTAIGNFTLSGVSRQVRIDGQLAGTGSGLVLEAEWIINIRDYDIDPPGILFYRVDEEIEVQIRAELESTDRENIP